MSKNSAPSKPASLHEPHKLRALNQVLESESASLYSPRRCLAKLEHNPASADEKRMHPISSLSSCVNCPEQANRAMTPSP